jgi:hypothetical protein
MLSRGATPQVANPMVRYVNCTINNLTGAANRYAIFDVQYDRNIIGNAGEFLMSMVSFSLPLQNLPLFIFPVVPNQSNPNLSTIQVGIAPNIPSANIANNTAAPAFSGNLVPLIWQTQELGLVTPVQNGAAQVVDPYYWMYSYEHFVNLTNVAVEKAFVNMGNISGAGNFPVFSYTNTTNTFSWSIPTALAGNTFGGAAGYTVVWNTAFDNLVNNFNTINDGLNPNTFYLEDTLSAVDKTVGGNIVLAQDYPTTDSFNSVQRILCLSESIPVALDYFAAPSGQQGLTGLSNTERIVVDVSLDFDSNPGAQRSTYVYEPKIYQLSDLESTLPLSRISLHFMWSDALNNLYEIPLKSSDVVNAKIGFYKKSMNYL